MKAITINPKIKGSINLKEIDTPIPKKDEVLVKVLEAGICRTDLEIYEGLYGESPEGEDHLIMGHESIGIIEQTGEYVVRNVRRPCTECQQCKNGSQDFCETGNYTETGIKKLHGVMAEYYTDKPQNLIKIPEKFADIGVLMEPLSFSEKAITQIFSIQKRLDWRPKKALIFGAGPIGILETMILRNRNIETYVAALSKPGNLKSKIIQHTGAKYLSIQETNPKELGKFDIILESSGSVDRVKDSLELIETNGVLCLTSITGGNSQTQIPLEKINLEFALGNKTMVGVVNAHTNDYSRGLWDIKDFEKKWPGLMSKLITRRLKPDKYLEAFEKRPYDIKTVIEF